VYAVEALLLLRNSVRSIVEQAAVVNVGKVHFALGQRYVDFRHLLKPETKAMLKRVLKYRLVVAGKVMAADVVKLSSAKSVSGDTCQLRTRAVR
jgi:hypothetical protein